MKQLLLFGLFLTSGSLFAQERLIVEYQQMNEANPERAREEEIEMNKKFPNSTVKMNTTFHSYKVLEYDNLKSSFNEKETINNEQGSEGNASIQISVGGEYKGLLSDLSDKKFKREVNLDAKNYIVNYPFIDYQWKITDTVDKIKDFKVVKAIGLENGKEIEAWFAPDLKLNIGPDLYNGLPGVILKLVRKLDNKLETTITYNAVDIEVNPKKISKQKPIKGFEISQDDFKKLQKLSIEKMKANFTDQGVDKK
jgi:GLPGLI family protein